jgi:surface polysaccharide O-acyltransferase-like enzyme
MVANANEKLFKYFIVLWFVGTTIPPFFGRLGHYNLDGNIFTIPVFVGYFILGTYLLNVQVRRRTLVALMAAGLALTAFGTYLVSAIFGGGTSYFFQEYASPTLILASVPFFLLLTVKKVPSEQQLTSHTRTRKLLKVISENTLGIFFLHLIVLYLLQYGYNGVALNGNTVNSIIGVPLAAALTLFICLAVVVALKKVPVLKHLVG